MSALGCGCEGDHLCLFHAKVRDYQIRAAGSEKAQRFLESLAKMPPEPPESPPEPSEGEPGEMTISGYLDSDMDTHEADLHRSALEWVEQYMARENIDREGDSMADPGDSARPSDQGDDSAIVWSGRCTHCHEALIKVRGTWICAGCDSIDVWPAMEGVRFYDQEADDA